jgi:hypothetical protein
MGIAGKKFHSLWHCSPPFRWRFEIVNQNKDLE